jgi:DNA-binding MarR family transcriptional regulator
MTPETTRQQVAHQILQTFPLVMRIVAAEVRRTEHTVDPAHFGLLVMLGHRPRSLGELAKKQGVSLPTMSKSISTLAERGWVTRVQSRSDRRVMIVELTPLGVQVLADVQARTERCVAELLVELTPTELERLATGVEVLKSVLPSHEGKGFVTQSYSGG